MSAPSSSLKQMITHASFILFTALGLLYLGGMIYAYSVADSMIFPDIPSSYRDGPDTFKLQSGDGEHITATVLEAPGSRQLLLYSHGNGEDLGQIRPLLEIFRARGVSVLAYDYPGYGTSSGKASEEGVYAAIDAAYQYATQTLGFNPEQIFLYGRSLGSGPSCWLAQRVPVGGLILDGAFSSTFRVMTHVKILPWDKFDNLARLPSIRCPVLLIHGTEDTTIPFAHALQNWKAIRAEKQKLWVEGAGHNDLIEIARANYWDTVLPFIQRDIEDTP